MSGLQTDRHHRNGDVSRSLASEFLEAPQGDEQVQGTGASSSVSPMGTPIENYPVGINQETLQNIPHKKTSKNTSRNA